MVPVGQVARVCKARGSSDEPGRLLYVQCAADPSFAAPLHGISPLRVYKVAVVTDSKTEAGSSNRYRTVRN